ncbi:MAG: GAP family protein [Candidatus Micrarchaeia archaeon]
MLELLLKIIPLGIASTLSPGILAVVIAILSSKEKAVEKAVFFAAGSAVAALLIVGFGLFAGGAPTDGKTAPISSSADLVLGALLVLFGIASLRHGQERDGIQRRNKGAGPLRWFSIAFILNITNFDAVLLLFTAVHQVAQAGVGKIYEMALVSVSSLFFLLPALAPLGMYVLFPGRMKQVLEPVRAKLLKYGGALCAAIFLAFGIYLLLKGAGMMR